MSPYATYKKMQLCISEWEAKEDIVKVLSNIEQDILMQTAMLDGLLAKS